MDLPVTPTLREIAGMFDAAGYQLPLVGGCVRDTLMGIEPADIDLATDATPEQQIAVYRANDVRFEPTGLKHGTITVIRNHEIYEITSFRTDVSTDGRHAEVAFTPDLLNDLGRRDFTMNAMAMRLDGTLIDPFGGQQDIAEGRVRFVGDARERVREDYLRILRWFRFLGRFSRGGDVMTDGPAYDAVRAEAAGLARISVERIWSEMSRILTGRSAVQVVRLMHEMGVAEAIGLPRGDETRLQTALAQGMDAATTLGGYLAGFPDQGGIERTVIAWKLSNDEKLRARFVARHLLGGRYTADAARVDLVGKEDLRLVTDTLHLAGNAEAVPLIESWEVPVFPIVGRDLVAAGMKPSPEIGIRMRQMRDKWIASDYMLTADDLIAQVPA